MPEGVCSNGAGWRPDDFMVAKAFERRPPPIVTLVIVSNMFTEVNICANMYCASQSPARFCEPCVSLSACFVFALRARRSVLRRASELLVATRIRPSRTCRERQSPDWRSARRHSGEWRSQGAGVAEADGSGVAVLPVFQPTISSLRKNSKSCHPERSEGSAVAENKADSSPRQKPPRFGMTIF